MRLVHLGFVIGGVAWLTFACKSEDARSVTLECGAGTHVERGSCVPSGANGAAGAAGAPQSLVCGPGTHREAHECVLDETGPECWRGTTLVGGACVPNAGVCEQGTSFDETTGLCSIDPSVCGPGTVYLGRECVPEVEQPRADYAERTEPNDESLAGNVGAPALGQSVTLHGCITPRSGRPDVDHWLIHASEPTLLQITADGVGGLATAFVVTAEDVPGVAELTRSAVALKNDTAQRQVYLPAPGDYLLSVHSALGLLADVPSGGPDTCYFTTVEHVGLPVPSPWTLDDFTSTDDARVRVLRFVAAEAGQIVQLSQAPESARVAAGFSVLRSGAFFGASSAISDHATRTVGGLSPGDTVDVVIDLRHNWGATGDAYTLTATQFDVEALPTDGTSVTFEKRNGEAPGHPATDLNYAYFDVPESGQVAHLELTSSVPANLILTRDSVLTPTGLDAVTTFSALGAPGVSSLSSVLVRFLHAGRYYLVAHDPSGVAGDHYDLSARITLVTPAPLSLDAEPESRALASLGSSFLALDVPRGARWLELAALAATDFGGLARITLYDATHEGWLDLGLPAVQSLLLPTDGSAPLERVVIDEARDYLVRIEDSGVSGVAPAFTLSARELPHVVLGQSVPEAPLTREADELPASGSLRYLVLAAAPNVLELSATPSPNVDVRIERSNVDGSLAQSSDAAGPGAVETLTYPLTDGAVWVPFSVVNRGNAAGTLRLEVSSRAP